MENGEVRNPYLDARREWNERYGSYIARERAWRRIALMSLLVTGFAVGGAVYIGSQSKIIPYVVQVDNLGSAIAIRAADKMQPVDERVLKATLARCVAQLRTVSVDATVQKQEILELYAYLKSGEPAMVAINEWFRQNSPFKRAQEETVSVEVSSVLPLSEESWQVEWVEILRARSGQETGRNRMKAVVTIEISPPKNKEMILKNPLGVYLKDISWTRQL